MTTEVRLSIAGMSCAGCVSAIEQALSAVPGVQSAVVNLGERTAQVTGENLHVDALLIAVKSAGYSAAELRGLDDEAEKENDELAEYRRYWQRAMVAGGVGLALFVSGMGGWLPSIEKGQLVWLGISIITLAVMILAGGHFFRGAITGLRAGRGNMDTLIALGTGTAWLYSTLVVMWPAMIPALARHAYFDAAVIIIALVSLGSALESRARGKTSLALKRLIDLQPDTASVIRNGQEMDLPVAEVGLEETIRIHPGDRIPVDGKVFEGSSYIDESMLTGEPMPLNKIAGSTVYGGTLNTHGSFLMSATHIGRDTALARIIELVRQAQSSKPAIGRLVDRVAAVFVPVVIAIALLSFILWYFLGPQPGLSYAIVSAMTVLVIACPCALGLATPISIMVGIGRAAEMGILIRNGEALQRVGQIDTVILDKTGTITQGRPTLSRLVVSEGVDEDVLLQTAAALEVGSEHPLAIAFTTAAQERHLDIIPVEDFQAIAGSGVQARLGGRLFRLGNAGYFIEHAIDVSSLESQVSIMAEQGETPVYLAEDNRLLGILSVADRIRPDSVDAIAHLKQLGLQVVMLTGDSEKVANSVATHVGIDRVIAEVMPQDKSAQVARLQQQGKVVAMVGDGINDAPALALADVGIAIGTGADVAIESADIALMHNSLAGVADAIAISRATLRNIWQNLFGAFFYNSLGIPVAAGLLYPFWGILLSPILAAAAMSLSSVTVVTNALRLRRIRF